jgi:hypothetical protein
LGILAEVSAKTKPPRVALKPIRLGLTPEEHHRFRIAAAVEGLNMMLMAERLVREYLAKQPKYEMQREGKI